MGIDESLSGDQNRGRFATALITAHQPDFLTVYLTALDHEQHGSGPDTPAAKAVLDSERETFIVGFRHALGPFFDVDRAVEMLQRGQDRPRGPTDSLP